MSLPLPLPCHCHCIWVHSSFERMNTHNVFVAFCKWYCIAQIRSFMCPEHVITRLDDKHLHPPSATANLCSLPSWSINLFCDQFVSCLFLSYERTVFSSLNFFFFFFFLKKFESPFLFFSSSLCIYPILLFLLHSSCWQGKPVILLQHCQHTFSWHLC